jgi:hypothetical protein
MRNPAIVARQINPVCGAATRQLPGIFLITGGHFTAHVKIDSVNAVTGQSDNRITTLALHFDLHAIDLNLDLRKPRRQPEAKFPYALDPELILYANLTADWLQLDLDTMLEAITGFNRPAMSKLSPQHSPTLD